MSLKEIDSKLLHSYNSIEDDLVNDFYNVVLSEAVAYDRIAGFFNSTSLALATRGIDKFIQNKGRMRLMCSPKLSAKDLDLINDVAELKDKLDDYFLKDYEDIKDDLLKNHIRLLGWMLANDYLEIKVGVIKDETKFKDGLFHPKIGVLYDENDDYILFDGSVNESASGWWSNIESLKLFRSWRNPEFMQKDVNCFDKFWNNEYDEVEMLGIPEATKNKLIEIAPKNEEELEQIVLYLNDKNNENKFKLRDYQADALKEWVNNDFKGIFSMATGTGKTFTALSCFEYLANKKDKLLTVIVCPQKHLISQWEENLIEFGYDGDILVASGDNPNWKINLISAIGDFIAGINDELVIFTTFNTFSSSNFIGKLNMYDGNSLLIVDEVHGIGALEFRKGFESVDYAYRLGLSATPEIEDDFERTELVNDYFGGIIYNYDLKTAIDNGFLTKYNYYPEFIDLNDDELEKYGELTYKIANLIGTSKKDIDENKLNSLIFERKKIIDNAEYKFTFLKKFLKENNDIKDLIIYCTGEQLPKIQEILDEFDISHHKFTGSEKTNKINGKSERDKILEKFANGFYSVLVGIKCLDEGVDVPSTKSALLMASTLNSRQHIQRRGRILRKSPGKERAEIYDLIVFPKVKNQPNYYKTILKNEMGRYDEYSNLAENFAECSRKIAERWEECS